MLCLIFMQVLGRHVPDIRLLASLSGLRAVWHAGGSEVPKFLNCTS